MTPTEEKYFAVLTKDRTENADTLDKRSMRGVKDSVVEKYSDQAHFIYELLQNADDAGATNAKFILEKDRLIFAHNGLRHFSVSNPETEDVDSEAGTLGDINSITSIANSTKGKKEATIGKFGVGFKAVFQYTATPHIYDPNVCFRIERFLVPIKLDEDFPLRKDNETLFVFPFDHKERTANAAFKDILTKLKCLKYPTLFLTSLKDIFFECGNNTGSYSKSISESYSFGRTTAEFVFIVKKDGDKKVVDCLWMFSREDSAGRKYSVGYFANEKGKLKPKSEPAFCYFPTKERTSLNFLIHAPFLLTDSREGIRAGSDHNKTLIKSLAKLAGEGIYNLKTIGKKKSIKIIDDDILDIIPCNVYDFNNEDDGDSISFKPFYTAIKEVFEKKEIIPTQDGYVFAEHAYRPGVSQLAKLISDKQLSDIVGDSDAKWAFPTIGREDAQRKSKTISDYVDEITKTWIDEDVLLKGRSNYRNVNGKFQWVKELDGITADFIEKQRIEWLVKFYKWLSETKSRTETSKKKPFFLTQNKRAVPAYDENNNLILFFPVDGDSDYTVVHSKLLENAEVMAFFKKIGIARPALKDEIFNKILPKIKENKEIDYSSALKKIFLYYCSCPQSEADKYIHELREYRFIRCKDSDGKNSFICKAEETYFPTDELKNYFRHSANVRFLNLDDYNSLKGKDESATIDDFFKKLGVSYTPRLNKKTYKYNEASGLGFKCPQKFTVIYFWEDTEIDECKTALKEIYAKKDKERSIAVWNQLLKIVAERCHRWRYLDEILNSECHYRYRTDKIDYNDSLISKKLKETFWLFTKDGKCVIPRNITVEELSDDYDTKSDQSKELIRFLNIKQPAQIEEDRYDEDCEDDYLTESQREKITFANMLEAAGITSIEEIKDLLRLKMEKEEKENAKELVEPFDNVESTDDVPVSKNPAVSSPRSTAVASTDQPVFNTPFLNDIGKRMERTPRVKAFVPVEEEIFDDADEDDFTPAMTDYAKQIERAKNKSAGELSRIEYLEELQIKSQNTSKYSYGWFTALLEMESISSGENNSNSREISISFAKVELEPGTNRTLVLKHPNRYIPQSIEDLADIPLVLRTGEKTKIAAIEVVNVKSYTLRVKLKSSADIEDVDLSKVNEARIEAKNPVFLLEELRKEFLKLGYADDFDMQKELCHNIEFIFGPPGTGKTTHLARNIIIPLSSVNQSSKILVLAPTNKAADVLVSRIISEMGSNTSYKNWLVRFGTTYDEKLENSEVYREKTFDIRKLTKCVTVTTVARFPYDFFMPQGTRLYLNAINWDYIIIDEASMIPISYMAYVLYKKTPRKFFIAGDPFQIAPIASIDRWKDENIYSMVNLNSFSSPKTVPHRYPITNLTTQYRSVPAIGDVFSGFAYDGILSNHRSAGDLRKLNISRYLDIAALNIVKFPVSKYESVYRAKRLKKSNYHIYSALFAFEFTKYLAKKISEANPEETFTIGVIAPYRAQADLIDRLLASDKMPDGIDVQADTIHGFQGDECDIIIAVFNPPPSISDSSNMFLNKKNIINVSISRAKDYLFVLMPDDDTENVVNLKMVRGVEKLIKKSGNYREFKTATLENLMFGKSDFLEENSFSTGHQSVNVYRQPEKRYEIRSEETAVDIQVHGEAVDTTTMVEREKGKTASTIVKEIPASANASQPMATAFEVFYWLDRCSETCPMDDGCLSSESVHVKKTNGEEDNLKMLVCRTCGKKYMVRGHDAEDMRLFNYYVMGKNLNQT